MDTVVRAVPVEDRLRAVEELDLNTDERLRTIEDRLSRVEEVAGKVPGIESRIGRVERLMLEFQLEMRRAEKLAEEHRKRLEDKLDVLLTLLRAPPPSEG